MRFPEATRPMPSRSTDSTASSSAAGVRAWAGLAAALALAGCNPGVHGATKTAEMARPGDATKADGPKKPAPKKLPPADRPLPEGDAASNQRAAAEIAKF